MNRIAKKVGLELPDFLGTLSKEMHEKKPPTPPEGEKKQRDVPRDLWSPPPFGTAFAHQ